MQLVAFVSLTRLHLRSWRHLPPFVLYAHRSSRQAQRSGGYVTGALSAAPFHLTFWTATLWNDEAAMRAYQFATPHKEVMLEIGTWCDEAAVAHRTQLSEALPTSAEALEFMQQHGRVTRLPSASSGHSAGLTVPDGRSPRFVTLPPIRAS